jgi:putative nucleotidyltransferase with HDIG domain
MLSPIAVEEVRIGMFIHLEGGWLSHPFPRSSFKLATAKELATLRSLGLKQINWSPEKSDPPPEQASAWMVAEPPDPADPAPAAEAPAVQDPLSQRRAELASQREALQRCERQYSAAANAWRSAQEQLSLRPEDARRATEALTQSMLAGMLGDQDIGIRLVSGSGGDRATAHALNVCVVSLLIGRTLGLAEDELRDLGIGALLHDIGKHGMAERHRSVDESSSPADITAYRDHVVKGVAHARRMGLSIGAASVIAQHHEQADGGGFPQRLSADRMTTAARIVAIVNRYDNLCNPPARGHALTPHEAVSTLFAHGRKRFDAAILSAFIRMMGVYPAGSLVQLTDDRFAMVVGVNSHRPLKPRVVVFDPAVARHEALLLNLEAMPDLGIRRSLTAAKVPRPALDYLDPRPRVSYYFEPLDDGHKARADALNGHEQDAGDSGRPASPAVVA